MAVGDGSLLAFTQRNPDEPDAPLVQGTVAESSGRLATSRSSVFENEGVGVYGGAPATTAATRATRR